MLVMISTLRTMSRFLQFAVGSRFEKGGKEKEEEEEEEEEGLELSAEG